MKTTVTKPPKSTSAPRPKKASGRNIGDHERNTVKVTLRLDPDTAENLKRIALAWKSTMGEVVEAAIEALEARGSGEGRNVATCRGTRREGGDDDARS